MKFIYNLLIYAAMYAMYIAFANSAQSQTDAFIVGVLLFLAAIGLQNLMVQDGKELADIYANMITKYCLEKDYYIDFKFAIYLRPFYIDGEVKTENKYEGADIFNLDANFNPGEDSLERSIARAFGEKIIIFGLGVCSHNGESISFGGLTDNWQEFINSAIDKCELILAVPFYSSHFDWELESIIKKNAINKLVFIMPAINFYGVKLKPSVNMEELWERSRVKFYEEKNIEFPKYNSNGLLFTIGPDGKVEKKAELYSLDENKIRKSINMLNVTLDSGKSLKLKTFSNYINPFSIFIFIFAIVFLVVII